MVLLQHENSLLIILCFFTSSGLSGLFCPCVLFGHNVESLRDDIPWTRPCICHAIFIEGGMVLAAGTAIFYGVDPKTSFLICEGLLFSWWMCGVYTGLVRQSLQKKYHLKVILFLLHFSNWCPAEDMFLNRMMLNAKLSCWLQNSPCDPCLTHCCLHWCALCQEHRERKGRLSDNAVMPMTVVNPPPVQQMKPAEDNNHDSAAPSSADDNGHTNMEMQAL